MPTGSGAYFVYNTLMRLKIFFFCAVIISLLAGCSGIAPSRSFSSPSDDWAFADLLYFDNLDLDDPAQDLLAVYARQSFEKIQFRLDFLDVPPQPDASIDLNVEFRPRSGIKDPKWIEFHIKAINGREPSIEDQNQQTVGDLDPKIYWQTELDYAVIEIHNPSFASTHRLGNLSVMILDSEGQPVAPSTSQIPNAALPSSYKAPLLLAFYDLMPGFTPAQTLRRWDGAHTGPFGQRHGLRYLLQEVEETGAPVVLLDLKKLNSLAALNYLGQIEKIRRLAEKDLLILPDVGIGDTEFADQGLHLSQEIGQNFGIPEQALVFAPLSLKSYNPLRYKAAFAVLPDSGSLYTWQSMRLLPLPQTFRSNQENEAEIDQAGLTISAKRQLVKAAQAGNAQTVVTFGGSLSKSAWGDAQSSRLAFEYIQSHPWIQVLTRQDLFTLPVRQGFPLQDCENLLCTPQGLPLKPYSAAGLTNSSALNYPELKNVLRRELEALPEGEMTDQAWQMVLNLTKPTEDERLQQLQVNYLGNVGHLIAGIKWLQNPAPLHTCAVDLDWDSAMECILASKEVFTTYELDGARLLILLVRDAQGARQWFGPASQFAVGLSDPIDWRLESGPASDPNEIPGAFADQENTFQPFTAKIKENRIVFTAANNDLQKTFSIDSNNLLVEYRSEQPGVTRIPLLILPGQRVTPEWKERLDGLVSGGNTNASLLPRIRLVGASGRWDSFYDSYKSMSQPENPSFGYPLGHYLPFPVSLLTIQGSESFSIEFAFSP